MNHIKRLETELNANSASKKDIVDTNSTESEDDLNGNRVILAIIGARTMNDQKLFDEKMEDWVTEYGEPDEIVSGGAIGADTMAEKYAAKHSIDLTVFKPDYDKYAGKYAPIVRNTQIIEHCTHVLAFPSHYGRGTQDSLRKARRFKRKTRVHWID